MKQPFRQGVIIIAMLAFFSLVAKPIYSGIRISDEMKSSLVAIGSMQYRLNEEKGIIEEHRHFRGTGVLVMETNLYILLLKPNISILI